MKNYLDQYYEDDGNRFSKDLSAELAGRDAIIMPIIEKYCHSKNSFMEYGFGSGRLLVEANKFFSRVVGFEISRNLISNLGEASSFELYHVDDLNKFSSENEKAIDNIVCLAVVEHVINPYEVLDFFHNIATDDATLVVSVPNYGYLKHRVHLLFGKLPKTGTDEPYENWRKEGWDGNHLHCFTSEAFEVLLKDCGWKVNKWYGWGYKLPWIRNLNPGLLSGEIIAVCEKIK